MDYTRLETVRAGGGGGGDGLLQVVQRILYPYKQRMIQDREINSIRDHVFFFSIRFSVEIVLVSETRVFTFTRVTFGIMRFGCMLFDTTVTSY